MASLTHRGSIVVGVDGSKQAAAALDWAALEAQRFHTSLQLLHAVDTDWLSAASVISLLLEAQPATDPVLETATSRLRARFPGLEVSVHASTGSPAQDLVEASRHAREVVVGAHGRTPTTHVPLGSVADAVVRHAACPVVVVREQHSASSLAGPVVVGVDGSTVSAKAVAFALEQAAHRGTSVVAIHAWWLEVVDGVVVTTPGSPEWQRAAERMELEAAETLAGHRERYPDVDVSIRLVRSRAAEALVEASAEACLVVVGARGRGGFAGLLLGSVSRELLMHAQGPVAVVRRA
jgi:nucleotide-binding universal stress UspA family protein